MLKGLVTYRGIGISVAILGSILLVIAVAADVLGFGDTSGFGRKQFVATFLGAGVVAVGIILAIRGNEPVSKTTWLTILMYVALAYFVLSVWSIFHLFTGRASVDEMIGGFTFFFPGPKSFVPLDGSDTTLSSGSSVFKARPEDQYYYFPYGVLGQFPEYTKHPMGFRVTEEIHTFRDNHPDDRVIVVLGGSAAYGSQVNYEDTPWFILEQLLNSDDSLSEYRGDGRFTTLNLSMPGVTVVGEMTYYLLFGDALRPDVVIAHDGFNDFVTSQSTDPYFLNNYSITYGPLSLADWAKELQYYPKTVPKELLVDNTDEVVNQDRDIIVDSYFTRVAQLKSIVERTGAVFLSGLQPHIGSKAGMCKWEKVKLDSIPRFQRDTVFKNLRSFYELYVQRYVVPLESESEAGTSWIVDFHTAFQRFGPDECIFFDPVHPKEVGNKVIAEIYHSKLRDLLNEPTTK